jgi:Leucine-rich repeat (LRR) protein
VPKKTARQAKLPARATASSPMTEAEARIAEARRQNTTKLDLSSLGLTEVPDTLFELRQLQDLQLADNRLQEIPVRLGELQQLQQLDLQQNQLEKSPQC